MKDEKIINTSKGLKDTDGTPMAKVIYRVSAKGEYLGYDILSPQKIDGKHAYDNQEMYVSETYIKGAFQSVREEEDGNLVLREMWFRTAPNRTEQYDIQGDIEKGYGDCIWGKGVVENLKMNCLEISEKWSFTRNYAGNMGRQRAGRIFMHDGLDDIANLLLQEPRKSILSPRVPYLVKKKKYRLKEPLIIAASTKSEWFSDRLTELLLADKQILARFEIKNIGASYKYDDGYKLELQKFQTQLKENLSKEDIHTYPDIEKLFRNSPECKKYSAKYTAKYAGDLIAANITDVSGRALIPSGVGMGAGWWLIKSEAGQNNGRASIAESKRHAINLRKKQLTNALCLPTSFENFMDEKKLKKLSETELELFKEKIVKDAFKKAKAFLLAEPDILSYEEEVGAMKTIKLMTYQGDQAKQNDWLNHAEFLYDLLQEEEKLPVVRRKYRTK